MANQRKALTPDARGKLPDVRFRGACSTEDADLFYPEKGQPTRAAKRICGGCKVRAKCLEYAIAADEQYGVFGGKSTRERRRLRRERAA